MNHREPKITQVAGRPQEARILIIDDEPAFVQLLRLALVERGYRVLEAASGKRGLALVEEQKPALVVLDLGLPDLDGIEVAGRIRQITHAPILVISARSAEADIVEALDRGANDYLTKPYREAELLARIRACLRGQTWREKDDWELGDIHIDSEHRRVLVQDREVKLTATEYKLLCVLVRAGGGVVTHHQLLRDVWGLRYLNEVGYLRVYMHHLRDKVEPDPAQPRYLLTEAGIGYRLNATAASREAAEGAAGSAG